MLQDEANITGLAKAIAGRRVRVRMDRMLDGQRGAKKGKQGLEFLRESCEASMMIRQRFRL